MKFNMLFLIIIISIMVFVGINNVKADDVCYKITKSDNSVEYVLVNRRTVCDGNTCNQVEDDINIPNIVEKKIVGTSNCIFGDDAAERHQEELNNSYINYNPNNVVSCGNGLLTDIPATIPKAVHIIYLIVQVAVPILLVVFGSIDFLKSVIAQKDDEIKKGQQTFIKRIIAGVLVFFVFSIVRVIISFAGDDENKAKILNCAKCFIDNDKSCVRGR